MKAIDSCKRKVRFKTLKSAWENAKQWGNRAYVCDFCDGYHTSSKVYDRNRAYDPYKPHGRGNV